MFIRSNRYSVIFSNNVITSKFLYRFNIMLDLQCVTTKVRLNHPSNLAFRKHKTAVLCQS